MHAPSQRSAQADEFARRRRLASPCSAAALRASLPLDAIVAYIQTNLGRRITLEDIAAVAELSVFQLVHAFRRQSTFTPYGLVLNVRIEHAKALLSRGKSIADAAYGAGFCDQSHLTRHFRRSTGITPKQYLAAASA